MLVRRFALPLFVCLPLALVTGCAKKPEEKLQGKWVGDRIENVSFEQILSATGWVRGTTMELAGNTMTMSIPQEAPRSGSFQVARAEKNQLTLTVPRPDGLGADEMKLSFVDEKTLRWNIGEDREVVFVRAAR